LSLIKQNPAISQDILAEELGVTRRTIVRDLDDLKEKGIIDREGGRNKGQWIIKKG